MQKAFLVFDKDNNGKITLDEIKNVLGEELKEIDDETWKEILNEADSDGDNEISMDEFIKLMHKFVKNSGEDL